MKNFFAIVSMLAASMFGTSAMATDLPDSGWTIGIVSATQGSAAGGGDKSTFNFVKQAQNNTFLNTDSKGKPCSLNCRNTHVTAGLDNSEMLKGASLTESDESGVPTQAAMAALLQSDAGMSLPELDFNVTALTGAELLKAGTAVGDRVNIVGTQHFDGKAKQTLDFAGKPCATCNAADFAAWTEANAQQTLHVAAFGKKQASVANSTRNTLEAMLDIVKE